MLREEEEEEEEEEGLFKADAVNGEDQEEECTPPLSVYLSFSYYRMCSLTIECVLLL